MNKHHQSPQPGPFEEPRTRTDYDPRYYPRVNGQDAPPPDATERNDCIKLQFLAAYYDLNCAHAMLLEVRNQPQSDERRAAEKKSLQAVDRLLIVRDQLEDEYAPFGVIADPIVKDGFTVNLEISFGNVDAFGRSRSEGYTVTAFVPVPLPAGAALEDLPIQIEGPGINPE